MFMQHDDVVGNFGPKVFGVRDVHRIGILDIRILNCDRNEENILVQKIVKYQKEKKYMKMHLIPIDHGLSLPDCIEICQDEVVWMNWP